MRVVVTGAAGFIGSHLSAALVRSGHEVSCWDTFSDYYPPAMKRARVRALLPDTEILELDVRSAENVSVALSHIQPDVVYHLAAQPGVRGSYRAPLPYASVNVLGTLNVAAACVLAGVPRLIYTSSSSVYGSDTDPPFDTDAPAIHPESLYAATKRSAELIVESFCRHRSSLTAIAVRPFTVYGPWGRPDMAPLRWTAAALSGRRSSLNAPWETTRDFTYVDDVVGILAYLATSWAVTGSHTTVNAGRGQPETLGTLRDTIARVTGTRLHTEVKSAVPGDVPMTCADTSSLVTIGAPVPETTLLAGLWDVAAWIISMTGPQRVSLINWTESL